MNRKICVDGTSLITYKMGYIYAVYSQLIQRIDVSISSLYQLGLVKWFLLFWMCELVALTQCCKLVSFLHLIVIKADLHWCAFRTKVLFNSLLSATEAIIFLLSNCCIDCRCTLHPWIQQNWVSDCCIFSTEAGLEVVSVYYWHVPVFFCDVLLTSRCFSVFRLL